MNFRENLDNLFLSKENICEQIILAVGIDTISYDEYGLIYSLRNLLESKRDIVGILSNLHVLFQNLLDRLSDQNTKLELKDLWTKLKDLASTHDLTGLPKLKPTASDEKLWAVIDLDDFKMLNHKLGHDRADEAIKIAADMLSNIASKNNAKLIHHGGDEFFMIFNDYKLRNIIMALNDLESSSHNFSKVLNNKFPEEIYGKLESGITAGIGVGEDDAERALSMAKHYMKKGGPKISPAGLEAMVKALDEVPDEKVDDYTNYIKLIANKFSPKPGLIGRMLAGYKRSSATKKRSFEQAAPKFEKSGTESDRIKAVLDQRKLDRRQTQQPFTGPDRRKADRRA